MLPAVLTSLGIISEKDSNLYYIASRYLLPAALVLMTLSIDLKAILNLGSKALVMFLTGTVGIIIPPSIIFIVYGFLLNLPISDLFVAGIIPGSLMVLAMNF